MIVEGASIIAVASYTIKLNNISTFLNGIREQEMSAHLLASVFGHLPLLINVTFVPQNHFFYIC